MKWLPLVLLATPGFAQDREIIDFELLFRDKAAEVVTLQQGGRTIERLALPGEVIVERDGDGIVAGDLSGGGAVGCIFSIYVDLGAALKACPALGTTEQRKRYGKYLARINSFMAENAYPPMSVAEMEAWVKSYQGRSLPTSCDGFDDDDMDSFVDGFLGPEMEAQLDLSLSTPRLPVMNPCL